MVAVRGMLDTLLANGPTARPTPHVFSVADGWGAGLYRSTRALGYSVGTRHVP
jgi:hypothetical protein